MPDFLVALAADDHAHAAEHDARFALCGASIVEVTPALFPGAAGDRCYSCVREAAWAESSVPRITRAHMPGGMG